MEMNPDPLPLLPLSTSGVGGDGTGCTDEPAMEADDSQSTPPPSLSPSTNDPPYAPADPPNPNSSSPPPPTRKRRRRKKQFPEMVPSHRLRVLRPPASRPSSVLLSKPIADLTHLADPPLRRPRGRPPSSGLSRDLDVEALIALAVGFPVDSLTEEEIESSVVPLIGSTAQSNYIVVRNHILARWRSNPTAWISESHAMESIRAEHRSLVSAAHSFLLHHGFINFGLAPAVLAHTPPLISSTPSVVIVGAGLAGLAAARHLRSLSFTVVILEGRKRPGGRVLTKKMEGKGVVAAFDLGGSVLTGINGNPLGVLARQLGFPLHKVRDECPLYLPDGRPVDPGVDSRVEVAFNQLLDKVCKLREVMLEEMNSVDVSLGTALEAFRKAYGFAEPDEERMLLNWHLANLEYANATMLSNLSMAYWDQDDPYEMGGDHCFIPGGNGQFVKALADGLPIFYDRTVSKIQYGCDGVMVHANGQVFRGDMALCTVPLGVLKKGSIEFVPQLPIQKQEVIERLGFGLLNKVAMLFPHDFWDGGVDTFGHLTEDSSQRGEFFLFYSYCSVSGGPLLVALVAGESAIKFEAASPTEPVGRVLDILRKIFNPKGIEVPEPIQVICTRWGTDKFTYGSYSYVGIGSSGDDYDVLAESIGDGRVFFAGEATNRRYPATMHGALLSGFREAAKISTSAKRRSMEPATDGSNDVSDLDVLFQCPDLSCGSFSFLYDPSSEVPDSTSLIRVGIAERKLEAGSFYLYGLISRKHVLELVKIDGDEERLGVLCRNFGTKLVGMNGLGSNGEALIARIRAGKRAHPEIGMANGIHEA